MKKPTARGDDEGDAGLHSQVGAGQISRLVGDVDEPLGSAVALEGSYKAMATNSIRDGEADVWCEALMNDVAINA